MDKECAVCGEMFTASRVTAKYCSEACKQKAKRSVPLSAEKTPLVADMPSVDDILKDMPEMKLTEAERKSLSDARVERMNTRLRAKGLPLISTEPEVYRFIPTGVEGIDNFTKRMDAEGIGGLPRKRISEIFGPKGSGKTSLIKVIAENNPDLDILLFDAEGGMVSPPPNIRVVKGNVVEEIMPSLIDAVESQEYDLIALDSVASLSTMKQFDGDSDGLASMARVFGPAVKRLIAYIQPLVGGLPDKRPGVAVLFINQFRDTTQSFGVREYTTGGRALEYYASLRLIFRGSKSSIKWKGDKAVGKKITITSEKNRFAPEQQVEEWILPYDQLASLDEAYAEMMRKFGITK